MISQLPTPARVSAPVEAATVQTVEGVAEYDSAVCAPLGAVSVGAVSPNVAVPEL